MKKVYRSKIGHYVFAISLGGLLWMGLSAFLLSFTSIGEKEGVDFIWQMVGFSFLLATLVYSVNPQSLKVSQRKKLPRIGISFVLSGVFVIVGYGIAMVAVKAEPSNAQTILKWMGQGFSLVATLCLSWGMTMMTLGFMGED
jgi:hypothetical protein